MKLLLQHNVDSLGKAGDLVEVSSGYARNYLLPQGLALAPTPGNLKRVEELRVKAKQEEFEQLQQLQAKAQQLSGLEVTIKARANEQGHLFGSIGPADIAHALKQMGFDVPQKAILLDPHIRQIDKYSIEIKLAEEVQAKIELWIVPESFLPGQELILQDQQTQDSPEQPPAPEEQTE